MTHHCPDLAILVLAQILSTIVAGSSPGRWGPCMTPSARTSPSPSSPTGSPRWEVRKCSNRGRIIYLFPPYARYKTLSCKLDRASVMSLGFPKLFSELIEGGGILDHTLPCPQNIFTQTYSPCVRPRRWRAATSSSASTAPRSAPATWCRPAPSHTPRTTTHKSGPSGGGNIFGCPISRNVR